MTPFFTKNLTFDCIINGTRMMSNSRHLLTSEPDVVKANAMHPPTRIQRRAHVFRSTTLTLPIVSVPGNGALLFSVNRKYPSDFPLCSHRKWSLRSLQFFSFTKWLIVMILYFEAESGFTVSHRILDFSFSRTKLTENIKRELFNKLYIIHFFAFRIIVFVVSNWFCVMWGTALSKFTKKLYRNVYFIMHDCTIDFCTLIHV